MNSLNVMNTLKTILTDLGIPEESIHEDTLLDKNLLLDFLETVKIALGLKRELRVNGQARSVARCNAGSSTSHCRRFANSIHRHSRHL